MPETVYFTSPDELRRLSQLIDACARGERIPALNGKQVDSGRE